MLEKKEFRKQLKAMSEHKDAAADKQILSRILRLPSYQNAQCLFVYLSIGYEVDTYQLIEHALRARKRVCVPRCKAGGIMDAVEISSLAVLERGMYDILEPPKTLAPTDPCELDFLLVPGMAFDRVRNRLGRGAGYYDRFLEQTKGIAVGVCRNERLFDRVPCEPHDRKMDILITETELIED